MLMLGACDVIPLEFQPMFSQGAKQVLPIGAAVFGQAVPEFFEAVLLTDAGYGRCLLGGAWGWSWG